MPETPSDEHPIANLLRAQREQSERDALARAEARGEQRGLERAIEAIEQLRAQNAKLYESDAGGSALEYGSRAGAYGACIRAIESLRAAPPVERAEFRAWNEGVEMVLDHIGEHGAPQSGADVDALYGRNPYAKPPVEPSGDSGEAARDAWRPVSEPPLGHDHYLVWCADWGYEVQFFDGEFAAMGISGAYDPTHWHELPAKPDYRLPMPNAHERGCRCELCADTGP